MLFRSHCSPWRWYSHHRMPVCGAWRVSRGSGRVGGLDWATVDQDTCHCSPEPTTMASDGSSEAACSYWEDTGSTGSTGRRLENRVMLKRVKILFWHITEALNCFESDLKEHFTQKVHSVIICSPQCWWLVSWSQEPKLMWEDVNKSSSDQVVMCSLLQTVITQTSCLETSDI